VLSALAVTVGIVQYSGLGYTQTYQDIPLFKNDRAVAAEIGVGRARSLRVNAKAEEANTKAARAMMRIAIQDM